VPYILVNKNETKEAKDMLLSSKFWVYSTQSHILL